MTEGKVDKIAKISKSVEQLKKIAPEPNKERFDTLMTEDSTQKKAATTVEHIEAPRQKTLIEEVRDLNYKVDQVRRANPDDLLAQTQDIIKQINGLKDKLGQPDIKIKDSARTLLRNKLTHIDESLKIALTKAGVEYTPPEEAASLATPIERFLGFLTHAESQLENLGSDVQAMHLDKGNISPASMLLIQIKVAHVQQELEFFTNLLNKTLESTKTIMNVQV